MRTPGAARGAGYDLQGSVASASHRSATKTITGLDGDRTGNAWAGHRSNHGDFHAGTTGDAAVAAGRAARAALARRRRGQLLLLGWVLAGRGQRAAAKRLEFFFVGGVQAFSLQHLRVRATSGVRDR